MADLTAEQSKPTPGFIRQRAFPVKASTTIYRNGPVAFDTSDNSICPADGGSTTLVSLGIAMQTIDNSAGAKGAKTCLVELAQPVETKFFPNDPGGGALTVASNLFGPCYWLDSSGTVTATSSSNSKAGRVWGIDSKLGVEVELTRTLP